MYPPIEVAKSEVNNLGLKQVGEYVTGRVLRDEGESGNEYLQGGSSARLDPGGNDNHFHCR